jgi:hypothetical protein
MAFSINFLLLLGLGIVALLAILLFVLANLSFRRTDKNDFTNPRTGDVKPLPTRQPKQDPVMAQLDKHSVQTETEEIQELESGFSSRRTVDAMGDVSVGEDEDDAFI